MHECLLCEKNMKRSRKLFGNGCINNLYTFLDMQRPKKQKNRESTLIKKLMEKEGILKLNSNQKEWFVNRWLTREYLEKLHYEDFIELKKKVNTDIKNIEKIVTIKDLKSIKEIKLKDIYSLYKKQGKFDKAIKKLEKSNFENLQKAKLLLLSFNFIFNLSRYKNQYEINMFKKMQFIFWQTVIEIGGKYADFEIAASFLQNSLEEKPSNLEIKEGKVVDKIKNDKFFKDKLNVILKKYKDKDYIDIPLKEESLFFQNSDLYFGINKAKLAIKGKKKDNKWDLSIHLNDTYDYTNFKNFDQYYKDTNSIQKSLFSSTLYNLAFVSIKLGVMKVYEVNIYFNIENCEVI